MKNQTVHNTPTTKNGTYNNSQSVDDVKETVNGFLDKVACAKLAGDEWVETTQDVIRHFNRNGMNGAKFFIYNGLKVCEFGKIEEIEAEMNEPVGRKIHGSSELI